MIDLDPLYISRIIEMKGLTMLQDLQTALSEAPVDAQLVFTSDAGEIGKGYHITELKAATVQSIDCGGNLSTFPEVTVQLLDGNYGTHMTAQKFARILEHSIQQIPSLQDAAPKVEYAPKNQGLGIYEMGTPTLENGRVLVSLSHSGAVCKPAVNGPCSSDACKPQVRCC